MSNVAKKKVKVAQVLANHYFTRGVRDKLADRGFDRAYEDWNVREQNLYEFGRQYVAACGENFTPTKYGPGNKRVNPDAVRRFTVQYKENVYC